MFKQQTHPFQLSFRNRVDSVSYREKLTELLSQDLGFHHEQGGYASHNFHSFPAKFPPSLPRKFILELTQPGDVVLDPMSGSGTTVLEAMLHNRQGMGFDIDPLALLLGRVKVTPLDTLHTAKIAQAVLTQAKISLEHRRKELEVALAHRWDDRTKAFVDYWFSQDVQLELMALVNEIETVDDPAVQAFLNLALSAIIITKSGGVSLAFDLAHTRPHRAKVIYNTTGNLIAGEELAGNTSRRIQLLTKKLRSPFGEFERRLQQNLQGLLSINSHARSARIEQGNAQQLPLEDSSVDLIVTSPPYASHAIDYMRAHKFALVWLGHLIDDLSDTRKRYIGGDALADVVFEDLPDYTANVVAQMTQAERKKGQVLHRYYSEMTRTLRELYRVMKPGRAAILVVGNSTLRGRDTETGACLADIGRAIGFDVPKIGIRELDRNRRMLPASAKGNQDSQIQQRMQKEYVIGFLKPQS